MNQNMSYILQGSALASLRDGRTGFIGELTQDASSLAAGSVDTAALADGSVTNPKLAANAVTTDKILDGTIVAADLAATGVGAAAYGNGELGVFASFTVNAQGQITTAAAAHVGAQGGATKKTVISSPILHLANCSWGTNATAGTYTAQNGGDKIRVDNQARIYGHTVFVHFTLYGTSGAGNPATFLLHRAETALGPTDVVIDRVQTAIDPANCTFHIGVYDYVEPGALVDYYVVVDCGGAASFTAPGTAGDHFSVSVLS